MKLGDFIDRVCDDYGGSVSETKGKVLSGRGRYVVRFLERTDDKGTRRMLVIPPGMNADTWIVDSVLRSNCGQLGIDPVDFGLAKDEDPEH